MSNVRVAGDHPSKWEIAVHLAVARDVFVGWLVGWLVVLGLTAL